MPTITVTDDKGNTTTVEISNETAGEAGVAMAGVKIIKSMAGEKLDPKIDEELMKLGQALIKSSFGKER